MNAVASLLLQDRRLGLVRQVDRVAANGGLISAFASYWLAPSQSVTIPSEAATAHAVAAKGAARTFREIAVLGYALAGGQDEHAVRSAFLAGLQQLAGRDFTVAGTHAPVCDDGVALLGLALGMRCLPADAKTAAWIVEACRISLTRQNVLAWDGAVTNLAGRIARCSPLPTLEYAPLHLAAHSRGLIACDGDTEVVAVGFLKALPTQAGVSDEEAILSLASLEWLLRSAPTVDLKTPSIHGVCDILKRVNASLHRWVFEDKAKTTNAMPRQWHLDNEYHIQSLLWAVLSPVFPDLREEEWLTPVGQKRPRADLCLPGLRLIVEVKFWRVGTRVQDLIEEIAADASLYLVNGSPYTSIVVFIWDDTSSTDQHDVLSQGIKTIKGIFEVVIQSRPGRFGRSPTVTKNAASQSA